jgi:hypothetical protein
VSDHELDALRAQASRADLASMARLALALHADGLRQRDVIRECYGVDFPDEFFAIAADLPLAGEWPSSFAWQVAVPPARGGALEQPYRWNYTELALYARDPDLVPLLSLYDLNTNYGGQQLCYRLSELAAGRSAVFGVDTVEPDEATWCGSSLLDVLLAYHSEILARLELLSRQPPTDAPRSWTTTRSREPAPRTSRSSACATPQAPLVAS